MQNWVITLFSKINLYLDMDCELELALHFKIYVF